MRLGSCLDVQAPLRHSARERLAILGTKRQAFRETVSLQVTLQGVSKRLHFVHRRLWVNRLQPDHPAPKRPQPEGPVEIDPQMPPSSRVAKGARSEPDGDTHRASSITIDDHMPVAVAATD